ncbi:MAG TPA: bifunctional riboflavin kinase/FAD synthetase [Casimicrobiaceae bacterium]
MRVSRDLIGAAAGPVALTIGNFDGVHRGHQAMLTRLVEAAADLDVAPAVLTFDPHPREFFAAADAPPRLSVLRSKLELFRAFGVAQVWVARFDARLAALPAEAFVRDVLERSLAARWLLVGEDFRFGQGRRGNLDLLRANPRGFTVEAIRTVSVDGERASSTAVRNALATGQLDRAAHLLGRSYTISGHVAHGRKLGRNLGFPTANLPLRHRPPLSGIFTVRVHGLPGGPQRGVASIGVRPTLESGGAPVLEVFLLDFEQSIYGRRVTVEFLAKLREEARYPDLETLTRQIGTDVAQAREYFASLS